MFNHGKKQYFGLDDSGGSLTNISGYLTDCSLDKQIDLADVTTLLKNSKNFVIGLEDNKFSISGKWDPTIDGLITGLIAALRNGTLSGATFNYGPAGNASGAVKYSGEALVASYGISGSVGDAQAFTLELQVNDDITVGTFS